MTKKSILFLMILALLSILTGILGWIAVEGFALPIWYAIVLIVVAAWGFIVSIKAKKELGPDDKVE
ncbi:MAG: hypothetical protein ACFWUE_11935 [Xylanivirga thermophila]|jgi:threonine/homoserine efflux transporter RhtA|uniref:hypothetical protein n=1 Tax=Xylanivirga thermophila TaxID=2496273 RepID=UPI00101CAAA5|nr:hypothetical protein [Xylanivirga thermophila]